jgi:DHA3 family macrolide efflux protein-like MFS transporter
MIEPETPEQSAATDETAGRSMRPFLVLWSGQALSLIGSHAVQFGLVWWLTAETGSATVLATATLVGLLPPVVLGPAIGALVDRWDRKRVMLGADGFVAAASLALAGLFAAGVAATEHVLALLFLRALGGAFHAPAMTASTSLMVPERHLTRVQGLHQSLQGVLAIVAAPLGALLLATFPMAAVMLVDVATALPALLSLAAIRVPRPPRAGELAGASLWSDTLAGLRYLAGRRGHALLVAGAALVNALVVPAFALLPLLVLERLGAGATELGWLTAALGVGMIAGGAVLGAWGGFRRRIATALAAMIALGLAVAAVGLTPGSSFAWALGALTGVGLVVPLVNGPIFAILQTTIAPELQGRVFALVASLAGGAAPLGLVLATPVAELAGVGAWYLAGGAACLTLGIAGFFAPALMAIECGGGGDGGMTTAVDAPAGR